MSQAEVIEKTRKYIQEHFSGESSGHDYWHMYRVWKNAQRIAAHEDADMFVVELAALLHDIADWKFHNGDAEAGPRAAREWLEALTVENKVIAHVEEIIRGIDFQGENTTPQLHTIEGKIVHDADKLDAMGAIGIARAFATGAHFNEVIHDPDIAVPAYASVAEYRQAKGAQGRTVINHFYEKLLLLKDRMLTKTGAAMAQHRHTVMDQYLQEFYAEWEGEK